MLKGICTIFLFLAIFVYGYVDAQDRAPWPDITLEPFVEGLSRPTSIQNAGDDTGRIFITEQEGTIRVVRGSSLMKEPFLNITDKVGCCGERGLFSITFPPGPGKKGLFYVSYTDRNGMSVISRYVVSPNGEVAVPGSEMIILTVDQPYANHNGGQIAFGPDGFLYIGFGDGGSAGDPHENGQNKKSLLGKILRLDVSSPDVPYRVPQHNPFVGNKHYREEIWALGLRNPWRFSFDRKTGDLYIADVGQNKYEEINFQSGSDHGGENYGWNIMEALHCFRSSKCSTAGLTGPVTEYDHSEGCSVTGGAVYRGSGSPSMAGFYYFGDYCSGRIWGLRKRGSKWKKRLLLDSDIAISTFGEDEDGEIYVADYRQGVIYRVVEKKK